MRGGGRGREAELYVLQRVERWSAIDANSVKMNQPGFDVLARHSDCSQVRISPLVGPPVRTVLG